jgi:hypothetical protein
MTLEINLEMPQWSLVLWNEASVWKEVSWMTVMMTMRAELYNEP